MTQIGYSLRCTENGKRKWKSILFWQLQQRLAHRFQIPFQMFIKMEKHYLTLYYCSAIVPTFQFLFILLSAPSLSAEFWFYFVYTLFASSLVVLNFGIISTTVLHF